MQIPTLPQAESILLEAQQLNPGPWVEHSRQVAAAASAIAACIPQLDPQAAHILGLLHDIGRRAGVTGMRHVVDGYRYLDSLGFSHAARICMTHSYPVKNADYGSTAWDGTQAEFDFVQAYLDGIEYDDYDRLIQLCDSIVQPSGPCLMEKRLVDVVMRYGFNERTLGKWKAFFEIQARFEAAIGKSIYSVLPGVIENTFGLPG